MKDGKHTTEFWLTLIFLAIALATFSLVDNDWAVFIGAAVVVSVYIYGRKAVKTSMISNYYGSHVGGDVVGGDKTDIEDISESTGIAIGQESGVDING